MNRKLLVSSNLVQMVKMIMINGQNFRNWQSYLPKDGNHSLLYLEQKFNWAVGWIDPLIVLVLF